MKSLRITFVLIALIGYGKSWAGSMVPETKLTFTMTTFNIQYYGVGGKINGTSADETRDPFLKTFLNNSIPKSDLIVFEEITDMPRLKTLLPEGWDCLTYESTYVNHQHVVLCHSDRFKFMREPTDNNDIIDEVAGGDGKHRPGLTTIVTDIKGNPLFRIVGVHLKAFPDFTEERVRQSQIIGDYLTKVQNPNLPVIIAGDFNTYKTPTNKQAEDDTVLISKAFDTANLGIHRVANDQFTWRSGMGQSQFDQFFMSEAFSVKPLHVFDICNAPTTTGEELKDLSYYNSHISDHCPVSAEISL